MARVPTRWTCRRIASAWLSSICSWTRDVDVCPVACDFFLDEILVKRNAGISLDADEGTILAAIQDDRVDNAAIGQNGVAELFEVCTAFAFIVASSAKCEVYLLAVGASGYISRNFLILGFV